jgi:hypothetical protein
MSDVLPEPMSEVYQITDLHKVLRWVVETEVNDMAWEQLSHLRRGKVTVDGTVQDAVFEAFNPETKEVALALEKRFLKAPGEPRPERRVVAAVDIVIEEGGPLPGVDVEPG